MNWNTAGTRNPWVIRSLPIRSISAAGSSSRMTTDVPPLNMPAMAQPEPPMWNSGMATIDTISGVKPQTSLASGSSANRLSLLSITPFGRPVVPDE